MVAVRFAGSVTVVHTLECDAKEGLAKGLNNGPVPTCGLVVSSRTR